MFGHRDVHGHHGQSKDRNRKVYRGIENGRHIIGRENAGKKIESLWSVWRQDDNGNVFPVRSDLTEQDALKLVREFEEEGHKQTYWVKPA